MSDDEKGYNGWTNYETWCVALWIDNDQGTYRWSREVVREAAEGSLTPKVDAADALRQWFEDEITPFSIKDLEGVYADLVSAAVSEIDWYEIAENYLEEIEEEAKQDASEA